MESHPSLTSRVWQLVKPHKWRLFQCLLLLSVITALGLLAPIFPAKIVGVALPEKNSTLFLQCLGALLAIQIALAITSALNGHIMRVVGGRIVFDMRSRMYRHVHKLSLSFYESRGSGEIMSRLMNDVASITTLVTGTALNTIVSATKAIAILVLLFVLDWKVALLAIGVLPLHFVSYFLFRKRLSHESWKASEKVGQIHGKANEVFDAAKMVKAYATEPREVKTLVAQLREGYEISVQAGLLSNIWVWSSHTISQAGTVLVMLACGVAVIRAETLTVEQYVLLMSYVAMLYAPIAQIIQVANQVIPAKVGVQRVYEILDLRPEIEERPVGMRKPVDGEVVFDKVCFAYPNGKQVLSDISFKAEPGQMIAMVGPSGSGKTTLANLIARFYDPTAGTITVDGVDIRDYALGALRGQMSVVLQETHLFRGTVRENLRYGKADATQEEIEKAAMLANAHEFIKALPDGYDTLLGNRGARLSGGQKQRLAIARALIREPRVLILDEATSALDSASEAKVQAALDTLMDNRTTFVIAHRLSTIQHADRILVLDNGRLVQQGTHAELIAANGLYRKLYDKDWARKEEEREEQELLELARVA